MRFSAFHRVWHLSERRAIFDPVSFDSAGQRLAVGHVFTTGLDLASRRPLVTLSILSAAKLLLILALLYSHVLRPFVGDNAKDLYLPVANRLLSEHRFNGPDSRPDSKVPPGYPGFLAVVRLLGPEKSFLERAAWLQMLGDCLDGICHLWDWQTAI